MDGDIIVGTDGSATAKQAVDVAIEMARVFDKRLHIVSAFKLLRAETRNIPPELAAGVLPDAYVDAVLTEAAAKCRLAGVVAETHAVTGDAADAILDIADRVRAGLIVVGSQGIDSKAKVLLGNIPSKVVHHAPCSTYVVHTY